MGFTLNVKKILVVEDSKLLQKIYELAFSRYRFRGLQLLEAYNGQEALNLLETNPDVDVILLDVNMPVMNGFEFLNIIKEHKTFKEIPVIIVTTMGREEDIQKGLEAGAASYVTKPVQPNTLMSKIIEVTSNS